MIAKVKTVQEVELELILAAKNGDQNALGELYEMHKNFIWRCALSVTNKNRQRMEVLGLETEDLAQVGFMKLMWCIEKFDPKKGFRLLTYAGRSMHRVMLFEVQRRRVFTASVSFDSPECKSIAVSHASGVVEEVSRREQEESVRGALDLLEARDRDIVSRRVYGETLEAVGETHGITKERVRQLESRAFSVVAHNVRLRRVKA